MSQARSRLGLLKRLTLGFVFCWFFFGGIAHFAFTTAEMGIVPPWLPTHRLLVLVSGGFELLGAAGILMPRLRGAAGWGLVLLTIAVTPANIFMWRHAAQFPGIPEALLALRLPFQAVLASAIWWSTRAVRASP
ncbi:MAG: hypothetical protein KGQ26_06205 [Rhodospirillales bacterium]|nr:hypothetical protein [Rhodospirillales bacterium]MDE2319125.1 hypothetical protein [Rhodospirillales bacterium]